MWWLVFLGVILLIIVYLLFVPIVLFIDTEQNIYYLQLKGLAKASLQSDEIEILKIKLKLLFFNFYVFPFKPKTTSAKVQKNKTIKKKSKKKEFKKVLKVVKTFKVKQFKIDIDTGDCIFNAKLYPLFAMLNYKYGGFHVNFQNKNALLLVIENRPIRIIKSFINH